MIKLSALTLALVLAASTAAVQAQALRPEIGRPLQQAADYLKAGKTRDAMAKVNEADAASGKTAAENLTIERMRGAVAQRAGDHATVVRSFESLFPRLSGGEALQAAEMLAYSYTSLRDYSKANKWLDKAQSMGGNSANLRQLQSYLQAQTGDYAAISKEATAAITGAEQAGKRPDEGDLLRLADAQQRTNNTAGQTATLEKLLAYYPKKDYWTIYLTKVQRKPGFSRRYLLDVMRLKLAVGVLDTTDEFMEMAQLSLQAGYPAEAMLVIDKGYASKLLGAGADADRHKRLRDLAVKRDSDAKASLEERTAEAFNSRDGDFLVDVGYAYVTRGQVDKGVEMIEKGIAKGSIKYPDEAKLRLGMAMQKSAKYKGKASQVLRGIQGKDGTGDIARMWTIHGG